MRISDWSSDVCSSDLCHHRNWVDMAELRSVLTCTICRHEVDAPITFDWLFKPSNFLIEALRDRSTLSLLWTLHAVRDRGQNAFTYAGPTWFWYEDRERGPDEERSEEHTSELQSLMRISYAVFCLK